MRKNTLLCFQLLFCLAMQAQDNGVKVLTEINRALTSVLKPGHDKNASSASVVVWPRTENVIRDPSWIDDFPIEKEFYTLYPKFKKKDLGPNAVQYWRLTEESGETVLHCYLQMPSDIVKNLWLASQETAIVDLETGVQYRAGRTAPADCMGKYFSVKAAPGSILDLKIYFPQLPPSTKDIAVYGVPNWHMRGRKIELERQQCDGRVECISSYDTVPKFHKPRLVRPACNYDKDNSRSWAVYTDAHLIKPLSEETVALWRTPDATYLAFATEQNWMREYFGRDKDAKLVDQSGNSYKLREVQGYPTGPLFWVEGYSGDFFAMVMEFEPLPLSVSSFSYIEPPGEPFRAWGANWSGTVLSNLNVETLRANQRLFAYLPRVIVK